MKRYWTSLTENYCNDWTPANAIREILQNALDDSSCFEYSLSGGTLEFTSKGVTIPPSSLLMGASTKRDNLDTVGGKGEGFKLAAVVLLRNGYGLTIYNGNRVWHPSFQWHEDFGAEILCFKEDVGYNNGDLTFEITGVDASLIEEVIHDCLYLQKDLGKILEGERGRVLLERSGKLYVGGLFVCDTNTEYVYDFHPRYLPLNRDRKTVSNWDLTENTTKLLQEVLPAKEAAVLTARLSLDAGGYGYTRFDSDEIAEESYNLVKEQFGELVVVASDYTEKEKLEKRGFKNVEIIYKENQRKLIQQAPSYQEFLDELEQVVEAIEPEDSRSPTEMLEDWVATFTFEYSSDEVSFKELLDTFKQRGVSFDS